jgi:hypothetical protein
LLLVLRPDLLTLLPLPLLLLAPLLLLPLLLLLAAPLLDCRSCCTLHRHNSNTAVGFGPGS